MLNPTNAYALMSKFHEQFLSFTIIQVKVVTQIFLSTLSKQALMKRRGVIRIVVITLALRPISPRSYSINFVVKYWTWMKSKKCYCRSFNICFWNWNLKTNRPYASKIKLSEFCIKKSSLTLALLALGRNSKLTCVQRNDAKIIVVVVVFIV